MNRPRFLIISAIISIVLVAFGLSQVPFVKDLFRSRNPGAGLSGAVTLEYWGLFIPEQVMDPMLAEYKKIQPNVTINYSEKKFEDDLARYKGTLETQLKEGTGPDIFRAHSTWMPEFISQISLENEAISTADYRKRFYPISYAQCGTTSGKIVCMPLSYDGLALFYNKEMFFSAGLSEPTSWEEVRDSARRLTLRDSNGEIITGGIALGSSNNVAYSTDILALMMAQSDVDIPSDLDTEAASVALQFYTNFIKTDDVWDTDLPYSTRAFATQKAAMIIGKSTDILEILEINPTLSFGVIQLPQIPNIEGKFTSDTWANFWVESVSSDASNRKQDAAWEFLEWLSRPEQQMMIYSEMSKYQRFGEVYSDKSLADNFNDDPFLEAIVKQAPFSKTSIVSDKAGNDKYADVLKDAINKVIKGGRGNSSIEVLKIAKEELEKLGLK